MLETARSDDHQNGEQRRRRKADQGRVSIVYLIRRHRNLNRFHSMTLSPLLLRVTCYLPEDANFPASERNISHTYSLQIKEEITLIFLAVLSFQSASIRVLTRGGGQYSPSTTPFRFLLGFHLPLLLTSHRKTNAIENFIHESIERLRPIAFTTYDLGHIHLESS